MARSYKLNNGHSIPSLGLGTVAITESPEQVKDAILTAIKVGYRHFDTAMIYGTEEPLGAALQEVFRTGSVKREDVFVTTKLWTSDNYRGGVLPALKGSLRVHLGIRIGDTERYWIGLRSNKSLDMRKFELDYVDLYLMHWPNRTKKGTTRPVKKDDHCPVDIKGSWKELEECIEKGLAKSVGVSNFSVKKLEDLLPHVKMIPAVNQVEMHVAFRQEKLLQYCDTRGIHISAYAPLGTSKLPYSDPCGTVMENPVTQEIAKEHGNTPAQILLRWILEKGASALPKSYNATRMAQNFAIFDFQLTEADHEKKAKIPAFRACRGEGMVAELNGLYKSLEELWDTREGLVAHEYS